MKSRINVVITVWNYRNVIEECLDSVFQQETKSSILIACDNPTDGTYDLLRYKLGIDGQKYNYTIRNGHDVLFYANKKRVGILENHKAMISKIKSPNDIVCLVDGDDKLIDGKVLTEIKDAYNDNIWCLWTQYKHITGQKGHCSELPATIYQSRDYWVSSHIKTFRKHVFDRIKPEDIINIPMAGDLAIMYPIIEMSGYERCKFLDRVCYEYNSQLPTNEHHIDLQKQTEWAKKIQSRPIYEKIID